MTRKDYSKFAALLKEEAKVSWERSTILILRDKIADIFEQDNRRFDREQFYKVIGL